MKIKIKLIISIISLLSIKGFGQEKKTIYFNTNEYVINKQHETQLLEIVNQIKLNNKIKIQIVGHTDSLGNDATNKILSNKRAQSVINFLIQEGVDSKIISKEYYGAFYPIESNKSEKGRAKNRRTDIILYETANLPKSFENQNKQIFTFDNNQNRLQIITKQGSVITIPKNSLVLKNNQIPKAKIRIEVNEIITKSDLVLSNQLTLAENGVLESGGMIKIKAYSGTSELVMKKDSNYYVAIPTEKKIKNMEVYELKTDTSKKWTKMFDNKSIEGYKWKFYSLSYFNSIGVDSTKYSTPISTNLKNIFFDSIQRVNEKILDSIRITNNYYYIITNEFKFYNIDKLILEKALKYGNAFDTVNVKNNTNETLRYDIILKGKKSKYYEITTPKQIVKIQKIKDFDSYLIAYKADAFKKIIHYDIIDLQDNTSLEVNLKMTSESEFKKILNELK